MVFDRDEIINHDGIFGIERADWEKSPVYAAMKTEAKSHEGSREAELLHGEGNRFGIYQVKNGDDFCDFRYVSTEELQARGLEVIRGNYELVYTAPISERLEHPKDVTPVLDKIYAAFNARHPDDYTGRSVSMSDVIVLKYGNYISENYVGPTEEAKKYGNTLQMKKKGV
jgi:hypothetical protein